MTETVRTTTGTRQRARTEGSARTERLLDATSPERISERLVADRKVRAVAMAGSHGTEHAWSGSQPTYVTFERGLLSQQIETRGGVLLERWPFEKLEAWRDWDTARQEAPLALLATSRVTYDPTGFFGRIQRTLWNLSASQLAAYRAELLLRATERLEQVKRQYTGPGHGVQEQLLALADARDIALNLLYPSLLTHAHAWPEFEIRLPHAWRVAAGLRYPKAVYGLEQLYCFGGENEARRVLLATRGLGMVEQEKRARQAFNCGYYDGAVRLLRDEAARLHRTDLERWAHLTSARREKLGTLLGVERSPLGPAAVQTASTLLDAVREGR